MRWQRHSMFRSVSKRVAYTRPRGGVDKAISAAVHRGRRPARPPLCGLYGQILLIAAPAHHDPASATFRIYTSANGEGFIQLGAVGVGFRDATGYLNKIPEHPQLRFRPNIFNKFV